MTWNWKNKIADSKAPDKDSLSPTGFSTTSRLQKNEGDKSPAPSTTVDAFLETVEQTPLVKARSTPARLIFSLDATASRQKTWNRAMSLQADMFTHTRGIGVLDLQLAYYRGYDECRASPWMSGADKVVAMMKKVSCQAGRTQISRLLKHALAETRQQRVEALVFIGDCVEEDIDALGDLAGQMRLLELPIFVFQEGYEPQASCAFAQIAQLSGGAHCSFDESSARQLGDLLNAVAAYTTGGRNALKRLQSQGSTQAGALLQQLDR